MTIKKHIMAAVAARMVIDAITVLDVHVGTAAVDFGFASSVICQISILSLPNTATFHVNIIYDKINSKKSVQLFFKDKIHRIFITYLQNVHHNDCLCGF